MKKILLVGLAIISAVATAQDIHFSQLAHTPLYLSPAAAGASPADFRVSLHERSQWKSIGSPYQTFGVALDGKLSKKSWRTRHFGVGLVLFNDKARSLKVNRFQGDLQLAFHQKLSLNSYLSAGILVGISQNSMDFSGAQWDNQYDGTGFNSSLSSGEVAVYKPFINVDAAAGLMYSYGTGAKTISSHNSKSFQIGASAYHLSKPKLSFYSTPKESYYMRFVVHGNGLFGINNTSWAVRPAFVYERKGKEQELVFGSLFRYQIKEKSHYTGFVNQFDFSFGAYYRCWSDAIIPMVYLDLANFGLGVSYDINVSKLATASRFRGGVEISLKFVTPNPYKPATSSFPSM